jgi:hypothetical protein
MEVCFYVDNHMNEEVKLNLGCGKNHKNGYINVDKYGEPDIRHDLELFPWPWEDSSISEIVLNHVLEHLGQDTETYLNIIKEIYRVCKDQACVHIAVPHPRHDDFINDPTHVRKVTPDGIGLFSKKNNEEWNKGGYANSPLGVYLNVDLEVTKNLIIPDPFWGQLLKEKKISEGEFFSAARKYNNVIKEYRMEVKVIKDKQLQT